jgi:hypothetical protein
MTGCLTRKIIKVARCKEKFKREFDLVTHRSKSSRLQDMKNGYVT